MKRTLFARVFALSLLIAAVAIWIASYHRDISAHRMTQRGRYTLRLENGRLTLWGPPPSTQVPLYARRAYELAGGLRNEQFFWSSCITTNDAGQVQSRFDTLGIGAGLPQTFPLDLTLSELALPLLNTLEDPDRIAVAHLYLTNLFTGTTWSGDAPYLELHGRVDSGGNLPPHSVVLLYNGLRIELWPDGAHTSFAQRPPVFRKLEGIPGPTFRLDSSSFDTVRETWHRRLDIRVASVPFWPLPVVASLPLMLLVYRSIRSKRRSRRGLCRKCGYSLTGNTSGTCPECGTAIKPREKTLA